jgi:protein-disulfide isomerase
MAEPAAEAAEFAAAQGKFWEMHDAIYENQPELGLPLLFQLAESLALSVEDLRTALANDDFLPKVRRDFLSGVKSGVNGTPTFFLNGVRHEGSYEFEELVAAIDAVLAGVKRRSA